MFVLTDTSALEAMAIDITTFDGLKNAIENAASGAVLNLNIKNNIHFTSQVVIKTNLEINIINSSGANQAVLLFTSGGNARHFSTNPSGAATLADVPNISLSIGAGIVLDGNSAAGGISFFSSGGQLILDSCSITNCLRSGSGDAGNGGGVFIAGNTSSCSLTMSSALVSNCVANNGGGIYLNGNVVGTMSNGEISANTASAATSNGGGVYLFGATNAFTINSGLISNNRATNGGGVFVLSGTLTINGGAISENSGSNSAGNAGNGGGVYNSGGHVTLNSGAITNNTTARIGGGVRNNGAGAVFDMRGGEISANTALGDAGGGVTNITGATLNLYAGKIIGNTASASCGGGVNNQASTLVMIGGEISANTALSGGGVLNWSNSSFTMEGGLISANITTAAGSKGGGIYNYSPASFIMRGGKIADHKTASYGGGINSTGADAFVTIAAGTISGNAALIDGGAIWIAHDDLPNLVVGEAAVFADNSAATAHNRDPIDDEIYTTHIFATHWTAPFTQGYNNFDISYPSGPLFIFPVNANISATKRVCCADLRAGAFEFAIFDQSCTEIARATNDKAGLIVFPPLSFGAAGAHCYTMRELASGNCCWITDTRSYRVIITISEDSAGQLVATVDYPQGQPVFVNCYLY